MTSAVHFLTLLTVAHANERCCFHPQDYAEMAVSESSLRLLNLVVGMKNEVKQVLLIVTL